MPLEPHSDCTPPSDGEILWRYMDFAKFVYLLEKQSLWFSRADQLEDPLEVSLTDAELKHLEGQRTSLGFPLSDLHRSDARYMRTTSYVCSWKAGARESLAMWELYGKGSGIVAVKTTVRNLKLAIEESPLRIFLGTVNYVDWDSAFSPNNLIKWGRPWRAPDRASGPASTIPPHARLPNTPRPRSNTRAVSTMTAARSFTTHPRKFARDSRTRSGAVAALAVQTAKCRSRLRGIHVYG